MIGTRIAGPASRRRNYTWLEMRNRRRALSRRQELEEEEDDEDEDDDGEESDTDFDTSDGESGTSGDESESDSDNEEATPSPSPTTGPRIGPPIAIISGVAPRPTISLPPASVVSSRTSASGSQSTSLSTIRVPTFFPGGTFPASLSRTTFVTSTATASVTDFSTGVLVSETAVLGAPLLPEPTNERYNLSPPTETEEAGVGEALPIQQGLVVNTPAVVGGVFGALALAGVFAVGGILYRKYGQKNRRGSGSGSSIVRRFNRLKDGEGSDRVLSAPPAPPMAGGENPGARTDSEIINEMMRAANVNSRGFNDMEAAAPSGFRGSYDAISNTPISNTKMGATPARLDSSPENFGARQLAAARRAAVEEPEPEAYGASQLARARQAAITDPAGPTISAVMSLPTNFRDETAYLALGGQLTPRGPPPPGMWLNGGPAPGEPRGHVDSMTLPPPPFPDDIPPVPQAPRNLLPQQQPPPMQRDPPPGPLIPAGMGPMGASGFPPGSPYSPVEMPSMPSTPGTPGFRWAPPPSPPGARR